MSRTRLYLAYGSNLNLEQMAQRCPTAKVVGASELRGYALLFRGKTDHAVATIEPREGSAVPVLLWQLRAEDEAALDGYEMRYAKQMLEIELDGRPLRAMTYVMTPGYDANLPSPEYLGRIEQGYHSAGFDPGFLSEALSRTEEAMEQEMAAPADVPEEEPGTLLGMKWGW